jgi:hypothetical protein
MKVLASHATHLGPARLYVFESNQTLHIRREAGQRRDRRGRVGSHVVENERQI